MTRLPLPEADVAYFERVRLGAPPEEMLARLIAEIPWRSESIVLWGRSYVQPRLIAWFGEPGAIYRYSRLTLVPQPWTDALHQIKHAVEEIAGVEFNGLLANYYRDHRDRMGLHSDDEPELGPSPTIASLSLGAERPLVFRSRVDPALAPVRVRLASGSLLLMRGATQRCWRHELPRQTAPCGPRVNLTFRRILARG